MNHILTTIALACLTFGGASAQEINDSNTPLHLIQPNYDTPYGIPTKADVTATLDKVLNYLDKEMPATLDGDKLSRGSFRLTSYEAGVLYSAMINAGNQTSDSRYTDFTAQRLHLIAKQAPILQAKLAKEPTYDPQMRMVLQPAALDDCGAMTAAYCRLASLSSQKDRKQQAAYKAIIDRYMDFVLNKQYKMHVDVTAADSINSPYIYARKRPHHNTVWLDDMYMAVPALAWYANYLLVNGDAAKSNEVMHEAINQLRLFKKLMWVPEKKLFRHGWVESMTPHPAFHWGRANGWAILTMCEVLDAMEAIDAQSASNSKTAQPYATYAADKAFVLNLLREHIAGLSALQDKTGFWHQLLDKPDTYLETSCTAIYTYCFAHAINEGWVDALAYGAQTFLGWNACNTKVNAAGQVEGTCVGTGMGFDPAFYAYRPVHKMAAHGYGPVIWAGSEVLRLLSKTYPKLNDSAVHLYPTLQDTDKPIFEENATEKEILW